jgi:hypothetical protein
MNIDRFNLNKINFKFKIIIKINLKFEFKSTENVIEAW